jgi:DNA end-binding protein Ku
MATTIWKGYIAFGLVSFPVRLHGRCPQPVRQFQSAPSMRSLARQTGALLPGPQDKPVSRSKLVKGFSRRKDGRGR